MRDYQEDLLEQLYKLWGDGIKRVLLQLPTGGGKTVLLAKVIDRALVEKKPAW